MKAFIGHEVSYLANLVGRAIDQKLTRLRAENVTGSNAGIIGFIAKSGEQPVCQKDLEKHFGVTRATASKVVSRMVRNGLIERRSVPGDARLKQLVLTERSKELLDQTGVEFHNIEDTLREGFTEKELKQFYSYIHRMQENMIQKEGKWNGSKTDAVSA
ncbi:MAG: MarR family winged helix-turn-helix transcriptional regulator [Clostridiales bacterium]|nr:MarR family winged helix-turn-helix transcriptional regulator [Clostridiales bacterium]